MEPTSLEVVRNKKREICDYCGGPEHPGAWQCPRIKSVTFDTEDDSVTVRFYPADPHNCPPDAA